KAEHGIRDFHVTGVQTCALPIYKFDIEWGTQGFTQGSGTTVTDIQANSYALTTLSGDTQYEFYVRQDCIFNQSNWVGPFSFMTQIGRASCRERASTSLVRVDVEQ